MHQSSSMDNNMASDTVNMMKIAGNTMALPLDPKDYWRSRMNHDLYRLTWAIARALFPSAKSAIDVGSYTSGLIVELDWIEKRVATDLTDLRHEWNHVADVEFLHGNAFDLAFDDLFDLVLSNQTIEHLDDPSGFVKKLLSIGRGLIISTTFETEAGLIAGHIQDPIDLEKFLGWFPCQFDSYVICEHPTAGKRLRHIIGVVKKYHPNRS